MSFAIFEVLLFVLTVKCCDRCFESENDGKLHMGCQIVFAVPRLVSFCLVISIFALFLQNYNHESLMSDNMAVINEINRM